MNENNISWKQLKDIVFLSSFSKNYNLITSIKFNILFVIPILGLVYFYVFFYLKNVKINKNIFNVKQKYISDLVIFYSKILSIFLFSIVVLGFIHGWLFYGLSFNPHYLFLIIISFLYICFHLFTLVFFIKKFNFYIIFLKNDYQKLTNKYSNLVITKKDILEFEKKLIDLDCDLLKQTLFSKEEQFFLDNKNVNYKQWKKFMKKLNKSDKKYMFEKASIKNSSIFDKFKSIYATNLYINSTNKWLIKFSILNYLFFPFFLTFVFSCFYLNFGFFDQINGNLIYTLLSVIICSLVFILFIFISYLLVQKYSWLKKYNSLAFIFKSCYVKMLINKPVFVLKQDEYINSHFFDNCNFVQMSINKINLQKKLLKKLKIIIFISKIFGFYSKEYSAGLFIWNFANVIFAIFITCLISFFVDWIFNLNFLIYQNFSWNNSMGFSISIIASLVILFFLVLIFQITNFLVANNLISINYLCDTYFVYPLTSLAKVDKSIRLPRNLTSYIVATFYWNNEYGIEIRKSLKNINQNFSSVNNNIYLEEIISFKKMVENKGIDWIETNELDNIYYKNSDD